MENAAPQMQVMQGKARKDCQQAELRDRHGEETPAYQVLRQHGLLTTDFRLETSAEIDAEPPNATRCGNLSYKTCCLPCWLCKCFLTFEVSAGQVQLVEDGRGNYSFYGKGVHRICDPFYKVSGNKTYQQGVVKHGDITLAVVEQGQIGFVLEKGQPILLPPGMHQWRSTTMTFMKAHSLDNNVIMMGPLTLVTVDSGYAAVTEDNGLQKILCGGSTYLLTHKNWKFQKFISQKIQSSNLKRIEATSADNVLMAVDATVIWRITDVESAALNAGETIAKDGSETKQGDIGSIAKLTNDVLKQAEASLAAFIGTVNYSDTFNVAAAVQQGDAFQTPVVGSVVAGTPPEGDTRRLSVSKTRDGPSSSPLFDIGKMQTCLDHANAVTSTYGVTILSINVVAAVPADKTLMVALAQGAVAAAEAQKFEIVANGKAAAAKIEAKGIAEAEVLKARGEAEAERVRAEGHKASADSMASSDLATKLALIDHTGAALGENKAFFLWCRSERSW
jgi:regulator of protease activity HflC (stomatin/prohibitin superfamily)